MEFQLPNEDVTLFPEDTRTRRHRCVFGIGHQIELQLLILFFEQMNRVFQMVNRRFFLAG